MTEATARVRTRSRSRAVDVEGTGESRAAQQRTLINNSIEEWVRANKAKNEQTRAEKAAYETLNKRMIEAGLASVTHKVDGKDIEAVIEPGEASYIDVRALYGKVDIDTFLKLVKATQGDVKDELGQNVLNAVLKTVPTPEKLNIKKGK